MIPKDDVRMLSLSVLKSSITLMRIVADHLRDAEKLLGVTAKCIEDVCDTMNDDLADAAKRMGLRLSDIPIYRPESVAKIESSDDDSDDDEGDDNHFDLFDDEDYDDDDDDDVALYVAHDDDDVEDADEEDDLEGDDDDGDANNN